MKINSAIIAALKPCRDRFNNYYDNYGDITFNLKDFILLDKITYNDKVWVVTRLFSKEQNAKWALLCASSILNIFESKYPDDKRPRKALEAAELYLRYPTEENKNAVMDAANAAYSAVDAAAYAAYSAAYATAYSAAYSAVDAANAANAAATYSAVDAANAASYDATAQTEQQEVNLLFMVECL